MPDFNDVVRHVILRIVVDSAGLAEELAKVRAQLKAAEDAEKESNKRRAKDAEQVSKAFERNTEALQKNIAAHDELAKKSGSNAQRVKDDWAATSKSIQDATKAQIDSINAVSGEQDKENKRQILRDNAAAARVRATEKSERESLAKIKRDQQDLNQLLEDRKEILDATRDVRIDTQTHGLQEEARKATHVADQAGSISDRARSQAVDARDQTAYNAIRRRRSLLDEEASAREKLNNLAKQGTLLEQRALEVMERRARVSQRSSGYRGVGGALAAWTSASSDVALGAVRGVSSAPRSFARAGREFDAKEFDGVGDSATRAEQKVARLFTLIGTGGSKAAEGARKVADAIGKLDRDRPNVVSTAATSGILRMFSGLETVVGRAQTTTGRFFKSLQTDSTSGAQAVQRLGAQWGAFTDRLTRTQVRVNPIPTAFRDLEGIFSRAGSAASSFFHKLGTDTDSNVRRVQRLKVQFGEFFKDLNRARQGGSGGSLLGDLVSKSLAGFSALDSAFQNVGRRFLSFQTLIKLIIVAFGPLAAIIGGVGAAALGLASNLVALSGVLAALPGLISAAVGGFGLLAMVIKPLSSAFSAYNAAQKAAAKGSSEASRAAVTAANALQDAQRKLADATLAHQRAVEDAPRAQQRLSDARKQATRDIEDYRRALQKLKYDEEGASLDVESAQQAYKRALVDPTSNSLDVRQARHDVEGALWNQSDQKVDASRTMQDAAEAFKKGVEGADAVVDALRGVVDANRAITDTLTDQKRAQQDLNEAKKDEAAGGSAARTAQEAYQAELAKLGPKTREVVEATIKLGDAYKAMRNRLSDRIFGQITGDTGKFKDVLAQLEEFLGPTADAFGKLAHQAINLFTNPEWKRFFSEQGKENGKIVELLGEALLSAADGFRRIIEVARPFTEFVVRGIKGMADGFAEFMATKEGRDSVENFLKNTQKRMQELWPVIKNLWAGFAGFFAALNIAGGGQDDFTTWFNKGLLKASETFKNLGDQARDPNSGFQTWLRNVRPLLHDIVEFLKSASSFFGNLFSDTDNLSEAEKLLKAISEKWLPQLADIFDKLSQSGIVSKVADAVGSLLEAVNKIADSGGIHALSVFADTLQVGVTLVNGFIAALTAIPGALQVVGTAFALVMGAALVNRLLHITTIIKGLVGLFQGTRNFFGSIKNPANADDTTKTSTGGRSSGTGRRGGGRGNTSDTDEDKPGMWSRIRNKGGEDDRSLWSRLRNKNQPDLDDVDSRSKSSSTSSRWTNARQNAATAAQNAKQNAKDLLTGDTKVEPTVRRIEVLLRQIEINTRRSGGSSSRGTGSRGTGGGGGGTGTGSRPTTPSSGGGGGTGRRPRSVGADSTVVSGQTTYDRTTRRPDLGTGVRDTVDPRNTGATAGATGTREKRTTSRTAPTTAYSDERIAQNARRQKVGLPPLPPDVNTARIRDGGITSTAPISAAKTNKNYHPNPEYVDYQDTPGSSIRRKQSTTIDGEVITPTSVMPTSARRTATTSTDVELHPGQPWRYLGDDKAALPGGTSGTAVPGSSARRELTTGKEVELHPGQPWNYINPALPGGTKDTEVEGHPNARQVTGTTADDDDALPGSRSKPALPSADDDDTPALPGGKSQRELSSTTSTIALPGREKPKRDRFGRFRKEPADPTQPRDSSGRFRRTTQGEPKPKLSRDPKTGRFTKDPVKTPPARDPKTGRFAKTTPDVADDGTPTKKPSVAQRIRDKNRQIMSDDSGSVGLGIGRRDKEDQDESRGRRGKTTRGRRGGIFSRNKGAGLSGLADALDGDDEYDEGYEDGLAASSGAGSDRGRGKKGRKGRRFGRGGRGGGLASSLVGDLEDDFLDDEDEGRGRRGGRTGGRGGRLGGLGSKLSGLGGGIGRGLLGGAIAGVIGGGLQLGGDALINKFVKNDKDKQSLSGGLSAVTTGASVGAMFGPAGALVGGAVGGIYALFKDKNLRDFVEKKLANLGKLIVDGLKAAGSAIGHFFSKTLPDAASKAFRFLVDKALDFLKFWTITLPLTVLKFFGKLAVWAGQGVKWLLDKFVDFLKFWYVDLPLKVLGFFANLAVMAAEGAKVLLGKFVAFLKFWYVDIPKAIWKFVTETIPAAFKQAWQWWVSTVGVPLRRFILEEVPKFFTDTIPGWFSSVGRWFGEHVKTPLTDFFTKTIPGFFTDVIPNAISKIGSFLNKALVEPIKTFFGHFKDVSFFDLVKDPLQILDWAKDAFFGGESNMSGGFVKGVYQGVEDKAHSWITPGEFIFRRSIVAEPGAKQIMNDWNEGRIQVSDLIGGLSAQTAPQVRSIVAPDAATFTGRVPTVVNTTVNHAPLMGDVTIHNPVREQSEYSLRRRLQMTANRHRR